MEKESDETHIQFWFYMYVTYSDMGTMNVIISDGANAFNNNIHAKCLKSTYRRLWCLGQWSPSAKLVSLPELYPKGRSNTSDKLSKTERFSW